MYLILLGNLIHKLLVIGLLRFLCEQLPPIVAWRTKQAGLRRHDEPRFL
jgi:hypothetical protein